jgi:MFS family permease
VWTLLREPPIRRLFTTMVVLTLGWDIYAFAIPVYGTQIGLSASKIGVVMGAFSAASFAIRLAMPFIAVRVKPWTVLGASLLTAGLSYLAIPFAGGVGVLMAIMFVLGLGLGAPQPIVLTLLHQMAPPGRGAEALGLRTTMINTSQTVMPLVFGALGAALGMAPLFFTMAGAMGLAWLASRRATPAAP